MDIANAGPITLAGAVTGGPLWWFLVLSGGMLVLAGVVIGWAVRTDRTGFSADADILLGRLSPLAVILGVGLVWYAAGWFGF